MNSLVCQAVVVVYLHHEETSKLVLLPAAFGCVLQVWKVWKVVWSGQLSGGGNTVAATAAEGEGQSGDQAKDASSARELAEIATTRYYDKMAGTYLGHALYPIVAGSALYSMLCGSSAGGMTGLYRVP